MNNFKQNTEKICLYVSEKEEYNHQFCILDNVDEIVEIYDTYDGEKEFLYVPSKEEIEETIKSKNALYLGYKVNGRLLGLAKLSKLEIPSAFFIPPKNEPKGTHYGCSGLLVRTEARGLKIGQKLVKLCASSAKFNGGVGIYADFDYRNVNSMRVISKLFNFVGFADGRNGAEGEQTIYTTFYLPLTYKPLREHSVNLVCNSCDEAKEKLLKLMTMAGKYSRHIVPYGGKGRYNSLYCLDDVSSFDKFQITKDKDSIKD